MGEVHTVEERSTGQTVAKVVEPTWGGGLVSAYLTAFRDNNPFAQINNHLSCGYAGTDIGIFRGQAEDRRIQYRSADRNLIDRLFSVN